MSFADSIIKQLRPSWASKGFGGYGGFEDLSGIEAKTAQEKRPVGIPTQSLDMGSLPYNPEGEFGGSISDFVISQLASQLVDPSIVQAKVEAPTSEAVPLSPQPNSGLSDGIIEALTKSDPKQVHSDQFLARQKMPMGQFPDSGFWTPSQIVNPLTKLLAAITNYDQGVKETAGYFKNNSAPASAPVLNPIQQIIPNLASEAPVEKPVQLLPARLTLYNDREDEFGSTTAKPNPQGVNQAIEGTTVAVDGTTIPFGKWIEVTYPDGTVEKLFTHDTGSAVKKRTASGGKLPVLDRFTKLGNLNSLNSKMGNYVSYRILD